MQKFLTRSCSARVALAALMLVSLACHPGQTHFAKQADDAGIRLDYGWTDKNQADYRLTVTLNKADISDDLITLARFRQPLALEHSYVALVEAARKVPAAEARVIVHKGAGVLKTEVLSDNPDHRQRHRLAFARLQQQIYSDYLSARGYWFLNFPRGLGGIAPHPHIHARRALPALEPVVTALRAQLPANLSYRPAVNHALAFVQSIATEPMADRLGPDNRFRPPLGVLLHNAGDSDSKALLLACLLQALLPGTPVALYYLDGHALVGITIPAEQDDYLHQAEDMDYVMLFPDGDTSMVSGQISAVSRRLMQQGLYLYSSLRGL